MVMKDLKGSLIRGSDTTKRRIEKSQDIVQEHQETETIDN